MWNLRKLMDLFLKEFFGFGGSPLSRIFGKLHHMGRMCEKVAFPMTNCPYINL